MGCCSTEDNKYEEAYSANGVDKFTTPKGQIAPQKFKQKSVMVMYFSGGTLNYVPSRATVLKLAPKNLGKMAISRMLYCDAETGIIEGLTFVIAGTMTAPRQGTYAEEPGEKSEEIGQKKVIRSIKFGLKAIE